QWRYYGNVDQEVYLQTLHWIEGQNNWLRTMVEYRWKTLNQLATIQSYTIDRFEDMIQSAQGNPGAFVRLWRAFVEQKT
ncbi:MAG: hypothetical protein VB089_05320, partial [Anaerolineaceae bacterium]|nr:hypothetical protein [Anaerolineaceae bacterium]